MADAPKQLEQGSGSKIVARKDRMDSVRQMLSQREGELRNALPKHLTTERLLRLVFTSIAKNPKLLDCTPSSLYGAVMQAAQLGLEPDGALGMGHLVLYTNKAGKLEAQFQPGYRGLLDLARRSGQISTISVVVVHKNDVFEMERGLNEKLRHVPVWGGGQPGESVGVYVVVRLKDGGVQWDAMDRSEVEKVRRTSRNADSGPWVTHWDEMAKKTMIKRISKILPRSTELLTAVALAERVDLGLATTETDAMDAESEAIEAPVAELAPQGTNGGDKPAGGIR